MFIQHFQLKLPTQQSFEFLLTLKWDNLHAAHTHTQICISVLNGQYTHMHVMHIQIDFTFNYFVIIHQNSENSLILQF